MIIACPACTTGFNLPETHLRTKGAKLRCSKCSHVFRVRLGQDGQPEIFYRDGEEPAPGFGEARERSQTMLGLGAMLDDNPKTVDLDAQMQADHKLNRTSMGMGMGSVGSGLFNLPGGAQRAPFPAAASGQAVSSQQVSSQEASSPGFNALPSFGETRTDDDQFDFSAIEMPGSATSHGGTLKLFDEPAAAEAARDDLFEGAFASGADDEFDFDPFTELSTAHEDAAPNKKAAPSHEPAPMLAAGQPLQHPARQHVAAAQDHQEHAAPAPKPKLASAFDFGAIDLPGADENKASASPMFQSADELVDPNFGMDAQAFDPNQGIVGGPAKAPPQPAASRQGPGASVGPPLQLDIPGNYVAPPQARGKNPAPGAPAPLAAPAREASLELAPHRIGGGGLQKVANLTLITMIVLAGFIGLIAGLNDGMIDFKNFGHMIDVAFGGKSYSPRPEWRGAASVGAPTADAAPADAQAQPVAEVKEGPTLRLKAEGTWAQVSDLSRRKQALVVRGRALNQSTEPAEAIKVRVIMALAQTPGEELASAEAFVGAWLGEKELKKAKDAKSARALLPEQATTIEPKADVPFTVIFDEIPDALAENKEVIYRVELR